MYNERRETFSIRDVVLQILFVALFIFILIWLFPTKGAVKKAVEPLYVSIYNENVMSMREAAKDYFTTTRLPKNVGDKVSITLSEMLEKKIVLPFVDSEGRQCDSNNSFVDITKMDDEYRMKINLKCSDKEDYIIVHMGCYNYCETDICEKEEDTKPVVTTPTPTKPKPTPTKPTPTKPTPTKPTTEYLYEYVKIVGSSYTDWSSWSNWTTNRLYSNSLTDVKTTTSTYYKEEEKIVAYKTTSYQEATYENQQVQVGTKTEKVCTKYETVYVGTGTYKYTDWVYQGVQVFSTTPKDTELKQYVYVSGSSGDYDCGNCSSGTYATYKVYTRTKYEVKNGQQQCAVYQNKETPIYMTREVFTGYVTKTKKDPVYGIVKTPITTTYYSYRTRNIVNGSKTVKWSHNNDTSLLKQGYQLTGNKIVKK
jgi:hypothetical protein